MMQTDETPLEDMLELDLDDWLDVDLDQIKILGDDVKRRAAELEHREVRALVKNYNQVQRNRKAAATQIKHAEKAGDKPMVNIIAFHKNQEAWEKQIAGMLAAWCKEHPVAQWAMSNRGVGVISTAGLMAHIDIHRATNPSKIWKFAGLAPPDCYDWKKGEKRPFNMRLKTICWNLGKSIIRAGDAEDGFYIGLYRAYKDDEIAANERLEFAAKAAATLESKPNHAQAKIYREGKLPPGRLDLRAMRKMVKLFLSHLHEVWWWHEFGEAPPIPWVHSHNPEDHGHRLPAPNWVSPKAIQEAAQRIESVA